MGVRATPHVPNNRDHKALAQLAGPSAQQVVRGAFATTPAAGLLVACPMQSTERIKSLDIKSLATVSERDAKSTDFVAWWYPQAPKGASCSPNNTNQLLAPGVEQLL